MAFQESLIVWLQATLHPQWDGFFRGVTFWGGFQGVILLWGFFIWCVSYSLGCQLVLFTQLAHYLNSLWLKALIASPRPFQIFPQVIPIITEKGFSFPSGHALNGIIYWGFLSWFYKKRFITFLSIVVIGLIGFSRIYLGVHYPLDILGGWFLGGLFLWIFLKLLPRLDSFFSPLSWLTKFGWIMGVASVLSIPVLLGPPGIPLSWAVMSLCLYFSVCLGWMAKTAWLRFEAFGPWPQKLARLVIGYCVLIPLLHSFHKELWVYPFAGFWLTFGAPALFQILGLTQATHLPSRRR